MSTIRQARPGNRATQPRKSELTVSGPATDNVEMGGSHALRSYAIAGGAMGKRRLDLLARVQGESTVNLLHAAGLRNGMRCVDVGSGGGHVTLEIARIVGRWGQVVGLEADPAVAALAAADAVAAGFENVTFRLGDARDLGHADERFHFAYARYLLSHVKQPEKVLAGMIAALDPGGIVAVEDVDFSGAFSQPRNRAFERSLSIYRDVVHHRGGDADLGPRLPALVRAAGLEIVGIRIVQPSYLDGEGKLLPYSTLEAVGDAAVEAGIVTRRVLNDTLRELEAFTRRPTSFFGLPRTVQVWAKKVA